MTYIDPFVQDRFVAMITRHEELLGERGLMADQFLKNDKAKHLGVRIAAGRRPGLVISKSEYVIECSPGTIFGGPVLVEGSGIIQGAIFIGRGNEPLVTVSGTGQLVLLNCILTKEGASTGSYVSVSTAGKAQINGCLFTGAPGGGNVIVTAGGTTAAVGNMNTTGRAHGAGVTTVGEVT